MCAVCPQGQCCVKLIDVCPPFRLQYSVIVVGNMPDSHKSLPSNMLSFTTPASRQAPKQPTCFDCDARLMLSTIHTHPTSTLLQRTHHHRPAQVLALGSYPNAKTHTGGSYPAHLHFLLAVHRTCDRHHAPGLQVAAKQRAEFCDPCCQVSTGRSFIVASAYDSSCGRPHVDIIILHLHLAAADPPSPPSPPATPLQMSRSPHLRWAARGRLTT